jgi:hypothetical protein
VGTCRFELASLFRLEQFLVLLQNFFERSPKDVHESSQSNNVSRSEFLYLLDGCEFECEVVEVVLFAVLAFEMGEFPVVEDIDGVLCVAGSTER